MNRFAVQVYTMDEWMWVTTPVSDTDTKNRVLVTFENKTKAEVEALKYDKARIVELENES